VESWRTSFSRSKLFQYFYQEPRSLIGTDTPMTTRVLLIAAAVYALDDGSAAFYRSAFAPAGDNTTATRVLLTEYVKATGATCLDGTPAAFYIRKGVGDGATKWYIHHQGGGWCESLDDCLDRSKGGLGSSKGYAETMSLHDGYFDPSPEVNPMMWNWNIVHMNYCDGSSFSSNNATVTEHKGAQLYFRGKRVREAVYASLLKDQGLTSATDVVISGCSAGGLATFLHTDQWCDALAADAPGVKCVGMPDSGFFLDFQDPRRNASELGTTVSGNYHAGLKWLFSAMNTSAGLNQDCIAAKASGGAQADDSTFLCQFAEHTSPFTHTPLFPLQSTYDSWQTSHVLYYPNTAVDVQVLGDNLTKLIYANLLRPHQQSGAFLDSCWHHCGSWNAIRIDGELVSVAFQRWYEGLGKGAAARPEKRVWAQGQQYPCEACCQP